AQIRETYHGLLTKQVSSAKLAEPQHLRDYVADGKLRLSLKDAIRLTLENNSAIRIQESQVENAKFAMLSAYGTFDPMLQSTLNGARTSYPGFSLTQGAGTFSQLDQSMLMDYAQTFQTGTKFEGSLFTLRDSNNSGFYFVNPYYQTVLNLKL